jgi:hypothetical protein
VTVVTNNVHERSSHDQTYDGPEGSCLGRAGGQTRHENGDESNQ